MADAYRDAGLAAPQSDRKASFSETPPLPTILPLDLLSIIKTQIVPRLIDAHAPEAGKTRSDKTAKDDRQRIRVAAFTRTILSEGLDEAESQAAAFLASGTSLESLFLDIFAPTAVCLGELWASDDLSFSEVTLASYKLHQLVRTFSALHPNRHDHVVGRVLLAPVPSNKHTLGVLMVEEFFNRSGWAVLSLPAATASDIADSVRREWFAVVGLSMSCDTSADSLPALIRTIREVSLNSAIVVLLGGSYFDARPEEAVRLGADVSAGDARHAVMQGTLLSRSTRQTGA